MERLQYRANTQTQIFKAFLGAAEVCSAQCWGARSSEGRKVEFSSENWKGGLHSSWAIC